MTSTSNNQDIPTWMAKQLRPHLEDLQLSVSQRSVLNVFLHNQDAVLNQSDVAEELDFDPSEDPLRSRLQELVDAGVLTVNDESRPYAYQLSSSTQSDDTSLLVDGPTECWVGQITTPNQYIARGVDSSLVGLSIIVVVSIIGVIISQPSVIAGGLILGWAGLAFGFSAVCVGKLLDHDDLLEFLPVPA